jgi:hypothetical protein
MLFFIFALDLELSTALNGKFHFHFAAFLLLEESVGFLFSLSNLFVENTFFFVSNGTKLFNLMVNHSLTFPLFIREPLLFFFLLHEVSSGFRLGELLDFLFLSELLLSSQRLNFDLFLVS